MPGYRRDFFGCTTMLGEPAQRSFTKSVGDAARRETRALDGSLNQIGEGPQWPPAGIGDDVLHADNGASLKRSCKCWMNRNQEFVRRTLAGFILSNTYPTGHDVRTEHFDDDRALSRRIGDAVWGLAQLHFGISCDLELSGAGSAEARCLSQNQAVATKPGFDDGRKFQRELGFWIETKGQCLGSCPPFFAIYLARCTAGSPRASTRSI
jgi:hypothetical protein